MKLNQTVKVTAAVAGAVSLGTLASTVSANADTTYTVQSGDTLSGIAVNFGQSLSYVDQLASDNNIANKDLIFVGQQLIVKAANGETTTADTNTQITSATSYVVNDDSTASSEDSTSQVSSSESTDASVATSSTTTDYQTADSDQSTELSSDDVNFDIAWYYNINEDASPAMFDDSG